MIPTRILASAAFLAFATTVGAADAPITLDLPVKCRMGSECFVQQYFDHDPSPGAKDYRCGVMVYDGHDGVDIRVPTLAAQKRGVVVVAAAAGIVKGVRDGMEDISVDIAGKASVADRECGNGVLIAHAGGWETQYCHMAKGSVRVKPGQQVSSGTTLGFVGESGDAAFPHLHLSVRHAGKKLDPFALEPARCGAGGSLWSANARAALAYRSPSIINTGFAAGPVSMDDVESGNAGTSVPNATSPALVAFVRAIGLAKGDAQALTIHAPDGAMFVENKPAPLDRNKAQWLMFAGKKLKTERWPAGRYVATYSVTRDGKVAATKEFTLQIR